MIKIIKEKRMLKDVIQMLINPLFNLCCRFKIFTFFKERKEESEDFYVTLFSSNDRIINFTIESQTTLTYHIGLC